MAKTILLTGAMGSGKSTLLSLAAEETRHRVAATNDRLMCARERSLGQERALGNRVSRSKIVTCSGVIATRRDTNCVG